MLHRLALGLGKSLSEIESLPSSELTRWIDYWTQEPWGTVRDNLHAGVIAKAVYHAMNGHEAELQDFMLKPPPPPLSDEEIYERQRAAWHSVGITKKD